MSYALNLSDDGRILSATFEEFAAPGQPIVEEIPDGNINDYLFINGEYICDPVPVIEEKRNSEDMETVILTKSQYERLIKLLEDNSK